MLKFKLIIEYETSIEKGMTSSYRKVKLEEIKISEDAKKVFYTRIKESYTKDTFMALNMDIIMEVVLSVYNQIQFTNYTLDKVQINNEKSINKNARVRVKQDIAIIRELFAYICSYEGYTIRKVLEYLGYTATSVRNYSKLFEEKLKTNDKAALMYECTRKILNHVAPKVNLFKDGEV